MMSNSLMMHEAIRGKHGSFAMLDIGTTKVVCFIGHLTADGVQINGVGHQLCKGMKSGAITDVGGVEASILAAVHAAEQMAGEPIENVMVSVNGVSLKSRSVSIELEVAGDAAHDHDIVDLIHEGCASLEDESHTILHAFPIQYYLDATKGLSDPRGMAGHVLGTELHVVTANNIFLKNITNCVARCHLNIDGYVMASHASALACLTEDERELGVTLIDMGGGVTSFSVFAGGKNIFSDAIPVGGKHVSNDIARGLSTTLIHAERLKTIHGSAIGSVKDAEVMIEVPQLGEEDEDEAALMPRSHLVGVVRPRMEEIFEMVRSKLEAAGVDRAAGRRCVLTGGGSQMIGVTDLASRMLSKQVRKGRPIEIPGLAEMASGPSFATAIGMVQFLTHQPWEESLLHDAHYGHRFIRMTDRVKQWFRRNV